MPSYTVQCANRETGETSHRTYAAPTPKHAEDLAIREGFIVGRIEMEQPAAAPSSVDAEAAPTAEENLAAIRERLEVLTSPRYRRRQRNMIAGAIMRSGLGLLLIVVVIHYILVATAPGASPAEHHAAFRIFLLVGVVTLVAWLLELIAFLAS